MTDKVFDSFTELLGFINKLTENPQNIYRGYNRDEEIFPSILHGNDLAGLEEPLLREFEKYGLAYFSAKGAMEFLSTAQHYGLPTRLLDFTYNPFVAMFFSLYYVKAEADDPYYKIIWCDKNNCTAIDQIGKKPDTDTPISVQAECERTDLSSYTDELMSLFESLEEQDGLCIADPSLNNQRIMMQQGLFLVSTTLNREKHKELIDRTMGRILIHKSIRHEALRYLDVLGFNAFRLMPDLASVANAVKLRVRAKAKRK